MNSRKSKNTENDENYAKVVSKDEIFKRLRKNTVVKHVSNKTTLQIVPNKNYECFYATKYDKERFFAAKINSMQDSIKKLMKIEKYEALDTISTDEFWTIGVITSYTGEKINEDTVYLQNPNISKEPVRLDLSGLQNYSIYNGQVCAVKGTSQIGADEQIELKVAEFYFLPSTEMGGSPQKSNLNLVVAQGPFLNDRIEKYFAADADVLIFLGPFVTEETSFEKFIEICKENIKKKMGQKVVLVPSTEDLEMDPVYPQNGRNLNESQIFCVQNPSSIQVNGHLISLNNFDVFKSLEDNELYKCQNPSAHPLFQKSKQDRHCVHLLLQKTFLQVFDANVFCYYANNFEMQKLPNIYITSSVKQGFSKFVCNSQVISLNNENEKAFALKTDANNTSKYVVEEI